MVHYELTGRGVDLQQVLKEQYGEIVQVVMAAYHEVLFKTKEGREYVGDNFLTETGHVCFGTARGREWFKQELSNQISSTPDVLDWVTGVFKMNIEPGESDTCYHVIDENIEATGEHVQKLTGFIIKGKFYSPTHIDEYDIEKEQCSICGARTHCTKKIEDKQVCNKCLTLSEKSEWNRLSEGESRCTSCSVTRCSNHTYTMHNVRHMTGG